MTRVYTIQLVQDNIWPAFYSMWWGRVPGNLGFVGRYNYHRYMHPGLIEVIAARLKRGDGWGL